MTDKNNAEVMAWFQQQQTPAGWFDLLLIMIDGMLNNAGELESQPFLRQMGEALADRYPLPESETVGQLEANINQLLSRFQWGVVSVDVTALNFVLKVVLLDVGPKFLGNFGAGQGLAADHRCQLCTGRQGFHESCVRLTLLGSGGGFGRGRFFCSCHGTVFLSVTHKGNFHYIVDCHQ